MIVDFKKQHGKIKELFKLIKEEKIFTEALENEIITLFGKKGEKAIEILKDNKLSRLKTQNDLDMWMVQGRNRTYLIINNFYCDCRDFYIRVINKNREDPCYHLLAKIIGEKLNLYTETEVDQFNIF